MVIRIAIGDSSSRSFDILGGSQSGEYANDVQEMRNSGIQTTTPEIALIEHESRFTEPFWKRRSDFVP